MKKEKVLFHQDNALCHKSIVMMVKLHELHFQFLLHPLYSLDLASRNYWLFADHKRILQKKRFGSNKEVISETEAYFEAKDKSFYKKGIESLEKCCNQCITLEGDRVDEWSQILPKFVLLVKPRTYWVMCYIYIYIYIYTLRQKYRTTLKNKIKKILFTIFKLWKSDIQCITKVSTPLTFLQIFKFIASWENTDKMILWHNEK